MSTQDQAGIPSGTPAGVDMTPERARALVLAGTPVRASFPPPDEESGTLVYALFEGMVYLDSTEAWAGTIEPLCAAGSDYLLLSLGGKVAFAQASPFQAERAVELARTMLR